MMKISVNSVHFHADSKLIGFIEQKLSRLSRYFERGIVEAEVNLKLQDEGSRVQRKIAEVHLRLPGNQLIDKKSDTTFEAAVNAAVDTLKRQLVRHKEKTSAHKTASHKLIDLPGSSDDEAVA